MQRGVINSHALVSRLAFAQSVLLAAAVVVLVAKSGGSDAQPATSAAGARSTVSPSSPAAAVPSSRSAAASTRPATTASPTTAVALPARLLAPPSPWRRVSDAQARTGPLDLTAAATIDGGGALSRTGLRQMGYRMGISRAWQTDTDSLLVLAYQFDSASGAKQYVAYATAARNRDDSYRLQRVNGIPGAHGFSRSAGGSYTNVVIFPKGSTAYLVGVVRPSAPRSTRQVNELAQLQYDAS